MNLKTSIGIFFIGIGISTLSVSSCSSSDDSISPGSGGFMQASVETVAFNFDAVFANKIETENTTLLVQGLDGTGSAIVLVIAEYDGIGTYDLSFDNGTDNGSSGLFSNQETAWSSVGGEGGSGTITINLDTATAVSGTFEFIGIEVDSGSSIRTVTNGTFSADLEN